MRERVIEDLVYNHPEEFFSEPLKIVKRQLSIEGRRLDLLFEDQNGGLFLVEIKAGEILREHVGQAGEYFGLLRVRYRDRRIRVALLGTFITPERRLYLEAIGIEIHIMPEQSLLEIARRNGVDPEMGIPEQKVVAASNERIGHAATSDHFPATDEVSFFRRVNQLDDEAAKDKLAAIYAVAKKSAVMRIDFSKAGSAEFTIIGPDRRAGKFLKIRVSFARRAPKGIVTIYWKYMLKAFSPKSLLPFATLVDELLSRHKADVYLDPSQKAGTFDEDIDLHAGRFDGERFTRFLEGIENLANDLNSVQSQS